VSPPIALQIKRRNNRGDPQGDVIVLRSVANLSALHCHQCLGPANKASVITVQAKANLGVVSHIEASDQVSKI